MLYFIIAILVIVIFYLLTSNQSSSSQPLVMSSKYNGLVSSILNWNKTSRVLKDESSVLVINAKVVMIDGESTFTLMEKPDGDLHISYKTSGDTTAFDNIDLALSYPQKVCATNHDLVWADLKEKIENAVRGRVNNTIQDLLDDFYGK